LFPFNRKSSAQPKDAWSPAKYEYEEAVRRCYKGKAATLALCGFQKFVAFNYEYGLKNERKPFVEDDFQFWVLVHEQGKCSKHVRCEVKIHPAIVPAADVGVVGDYCGWFVLTHISLPRDKTPPEEQALLLDVTLYDPISLKTSLIDGLRDAALSGFRFMHIQLDCPESTNEECEKAVSDIRAQGYAYSRNIVAVRMWPKIELQNAPKFSRRED
jgi:hypothetical protein